MPVDGRKVRGTIHWVSAETAVPAKVKLYDYLFTIEDTGAIPEDKSFRDFLNTESLTVMENAVLEPSFAQDDEGERYQFVRTGYFIRDSRDKNSFIRIVGLKDGYKPAK